MKLFRATQSSVVHIEAVLMSNQSPVWPANFSDVYGYSGLQALFVAVFQTSVDFLCKNSYKSSSLQGYFNCFLSSHTVGCCSINFSCLSQIRREKFCFASNVSIFLLSFFARLQLSQCHVWPTFHPETPSVIFVLAPLLMLMACWKSNFFRIFMGNYWEMNTEREIFLLNRFANIKAKSCFMHFSPL